MTVVRDLAPEIFLVVSRRCTRPFMPEFWRNTAEDLDTLKRYGYAAIDMVVSNLYPFQETVAQQ